MIQSKTTQEIDDILSHLLRHQKEIEELIDIRNDWAELMIRFHQHNEGILDERELLKRLDSLIYRAHEQVLQSKPAMVDDGTGVRKSLKPKLPNDVRKISNAKQEAAISEAKRSSSCLAHNQKEDKTASYRRPLGGK